MREEINWAQVYDTWDDVVALKSHWCFDRNQSVAEDKANVIGVLRYLRKSRSFQSSCTWQPLLEDAFMKISAVAKSWEDD